jgi:hypothetical protein
MALEDSTNPMQGVSGPANYAKRTDLEYKPDAYGEGVAYAANKGGAPLATAQKSPMLSEAPSVPTGGSAPVSMPGLYDPTNRPNEPITAGIDRGDGPGSSALGMNKVAVRTSDTLAKLIPFDTDGSITILYQQAVARGD